MGRMKEVYMRFLEEVRYDKSLTADEWLRRVAYTKNKQPKTKENVNPDQTPSRGK